MTLRELIEKIKTTENLSEKKKSFWLSQIPKMTKPQLKKLASFLTWIETQINNLDNEAEKITTSIQTAFIDMNNHIKKQAKKTTLKWVETKIKEGEDEKIKTLLKQTENGH
jgi:hypothetical protein